jgi:predicted KAP-like P-loop ATPase
MSVSKDLKNTDAKTVPNDNPIRRLEDDSLGRAHSARLFARQVLSVDASEGVVVGVLGSWGSGKTSFINLARIELDAARIPVFDFNPWMFSGEEQLMDSFFNELTTQLRLRPGIRRDLYGR